VLWSNPRTTEILIGVFYYNESAWELAQTIIHIMKSAEMLSTRQRSRIWDENAYQKFVICIIAAQPIVNQRVLAMLTTFGIWIDWACVSSVNDSQVRAHLFEVSLDCIIPLLG
jgi:chitin synthase